MSAPNAQSLYLSLEEFYLAHAQRLNPVIGERAAQYAWSLKDQDQATPEGEALCRKTQAALGKALAGRPAEWVIEVSESQAFLSVEAWIEDSLRRSVDASKEHLTGFGDLDLNIETQLNCGMQLEAFHSGDWAKAKLSALFEPQSFREEEEPIVMPFETPLPKVLWTMDQDMAGVVRGGIRHRYQCSAAVGALFLRLPAFEGAPEQLIPVVRRLRTSDVKLAVDLLGEELAERCKTLAEVVKEHQATLRLLPEGWPNQEVYDTMRQWAERRFVGDNGLVGTDLFHGDWVRDNMPHEIHRRITEPAELEKLGLGERMAHRRAPKAPEPGSDAAGQTLPSTPAPRL